MPMAILWIIQDTACAVAYDIISASGHMGPIKVLSKCVVHLALTGVSFEWGVERNDFYELLVRQRDQDLDFATNVYFVDKQAVLVYCKLTVASHYLGCCGTANFILLLSSFYFDKCRRVIHGFFITPPGA